jgi:nucleoside-diphosphate-sugar epimerase
MTSPLHDAPILITGATGLIGRHLVRALIDRRADVFAVVRPGRERLLPGEARPVIWDLRDDHPGSPLPRRLSAVVHLAGPRDRRTPSFAALSGHIRLTVDAAARLFEAARVRRVSHVISVSSISVYGPRPRRKGAGGERTIVTAPTHPYPLVKRWGEDLAVTLREHIRHVTIARPGPVYGPGQSPFGLLPKFAASLRRREPIRIAAPRGRLVSPVFVGDVVSALVHALAAPSNETWDVGGPTAHRERDLILDLARHLGLPACIQSDRGRSPALFDIDNTVVDRLFPLRVRTPWTAGLQATWRRKLPKANGVSVPKITRTPGA